MCSVMGEPVVKPCRMPLKRLGAIGLDQHPASAAVSGLTAAQFGGDGVEVDRRSPAGTPSRIAVKRLSMATRRR